jgi:hypothetical protein
VIGGLVSTEYRSVNLASLLPAFMGKVEDAEQLGELTAAIAAANPHADIDFLEVHLATLRCDFDDAVSRATAWARREIFNADAAGQAIYLLADVNEDYERALEIGLPALARVPASIQLRNNVAYALALSGRYDEARAVLPASPTDSVFFEATAALIEMLSGNVKGGFAGYQRAHDLAVEQEKEDLARLVLMHWLLAVHRYVKQHDLSVDDLPSLALPQDWDNDPQLILVREIARRVCAPLEIAQPQ